MDETEFNTGAIRESVYNFLKDVNELVYTNIMNTDTITADLIDKDFLEEIRKSTSSDDGPIIFFGKSLRELKCTIKDNYGRDHEVYLLYKGPRKLNISGFSFPYLSLQEQEFKSINEIVSAVQEHLESLVSYFNQLENLDQFCCVMEPSNPTFKDDYRRIFLDERTWLHIEVTPDGLATNIHLIGQSSSWHDKLNKGLLSWDHDKSIVDNIMEVFDLTSFPMPETKQNILDYVQSPEEIACGICLCSELPGNTGMPLPICQNKACGVYFHRICLFELPPVRKDLRDEELARNFTWLVACSGGRPPAFGVASGSCPTCLQSISCGDKDN